MTEKLAKHMFLMQVEHMTDGHDAAVMAELAWLDPDIQFFWKMQASEVLDFLEEAGYENTSVELQG